MTLLWKHNIGNIWCRGDSITAGWNDQVGGWRTTLKSNLAAQGISANFVGSLTDVNGDKHDGFASDTCVSASANVQAAASLYRPALTLFFLGTNDEWFGSNLATIKTNWDACVVNIFTGCPWTKMIVMDPIDRTDHTSGTLAIATAMPSWVAAHVAAGRNVTLCSVRSSITTAQTSDGTHPTAAGYLLMAVPITTAVIAAL